MDKNLFIKLANLFEENGFKLFMVGGTSRDYLLGKEVYDYDFASDAKIDEIIKFLPDVNLYSAKYGSCHLKLDNVHLDITTLRKESDYLDYRHPSKIEFIKDIKEDYIRRDFTINAIYIDKDFKVYDFSNGLELEFSSTENDDLIGNNWVVDSYNKVIECVLGDDEFFKANIDTYMDVDRTIDYILETMLFCGWDNLIHNIIFVTFDGVKWYPSMYDLDRCFEKNYPADYDVDVTKHKLFERFMDLFSTEIKERYFELTTNLITPKLVSNLFKNYTSKVSYTLFKTDADKHGNKLLTPDEYLNIPNQFENYFETRLNHLNEVFNQ